MSNLSSNAPDPPNEGSGPSRDKGWEAVYEFAFGVTGFAAISCFFWSFEFFVTMHLWSSGGLLLAGCFLWKLAGKFHDESST
jgi:hypothetical protein